MSLAKRLANYAVGLKFEQLDAATVHEVRRRVIDSFACALGAWEAPAAAVARKVAGRVSRIPRANRSGCRRTDPPRSCR